jgi:26S proteasome regulatory subunit T3
MNLGHDVDLESLVQRTEKLSSADVQAICQEAGMIAVRKNRYVVIQKDFEKAFKNVLRRAKKELQFYSL